MAAQEAQLMSPEDLAAQAQWDEEFKRRQEDMARRELQSRERRRAVSSKLQELDQRWKMMEQRRVLRSRQNATTDTTSQRL
ncbi:uncharacterized protein LOC143286453 [Babylonia areolata]|uniref:uncharacterized protein LOC143286453 n=1 Tax=Babylonia areolata TaxID=304850 RepID=UPI003FD3258F